MPEREPSGGEPLQCNHQALWDCKPSHSDITCASSRPALRGGAWWCFLLCVTSNLHLHTWLGWMPGAGLELSHALNACRGHVRCSRGGMQVGGEDCGFLSPPDVACSEFRASYWTGRCDGRGEHGSPSLQRCMEWHARWAVKSCYPDDEHLEAHVRWARHRCSPEGSDIFLTRGALSASRHAGAGSEAARDTAAAPAEQQQQQKYEHCRGIANRFAEQADRWHEA
eukprot:CAMPEP_0115878354 /NCGR_PEP_ID=MMETSP0287-20121206/26727_1 /TAXON_ID=412157 /ORGANISM="Chrysochromulina rotalis, Strain UIO044" /LENGTH=224 /DNA_ID=CAMNT_0003333961 /DNA_START=82 /DNA_END=756 /DNA_ORIENTATION=-